MRGRVSGEATDGRPRENVFGHGFGFTFRFAVGSRQRGLT